MDRIAVSLAEAEELISISRFTLARKIKSGSLKASRIGRRIVIPITELEKLISLGRSGDANGRQKPK
jgi:excisionase family DNA binding protein